ncbi:MAG TPA: trehalose-phosphatase [Chloroflexota bacterium]|jgi:trehalose 6-phosphate phosphatase|nr:trehalose-phosphatase [Chloroflexota bacterium]
MTPRPSLERVVELAAGVLAHAPAGLATDFDGTLSPIVLHPDEARILPEARVALRRLSGPLRLVAVVSGRPVADLVVRVGLPSAVYVGNHGVERWRDGLALMPTPTAEQAAALAAARDMLEEALADVPGIHFEEKNLGFAVHYREAPRPEPIRTRVFGLAGHLARLGLAAREGKRVFEIRFVGSPTKGSSVDWLVDEHGLRGMVFVGDDHTDVDAFRALRARRARGEVQALSVAVLGAETPQVVREAADVAVAGPDEVADLLCRLADRLSPTETPAEAAAASSAVRAAS